MWTEMFLLYLTSPHDGTLLSMAHHVPSCPHLARLRCNHSGWCNHCT